MTDSLRIRWGMWNASTVALAAAICVLATFPLATAKVTGAGSATPSADTAKASPALQKLADGHPTQRVEAIVQLERGTTPGAGKQLVAELGGRTTGELPIINGLAARMSASAAVKLADEAAVRVVSLNAAVKKNAIGTSSIDSSQLATSYPDSVQAPTAWGVPATGKGVGVAVIDTGIAGDLADFRKSSSDTTSREIASVVTNPYARTDLDIFGLQFVVDFRSTYNIRVVNLSLESTDAQSYKTDPLDAAAEAAWFNDVVVVAAAGNRGTSGDAVRYAPGNDPYVISVGAVDDQGTKNTLDDTLADWSSRGATQDGYAKPDVVAPGAHIVSNLAPNSQFTSLCPSCIVDGQYIRAGGTSMSAPVVSGAIADLLQMHPGYTPNQVKGAVLATGRKIGDQQTMEVSVDQLILASPGVSNQGLTPNTLIDPKSGNIDYTRSSWSRSSWSRSS